mmetsp:Transcript_3227/g.8064  ORF Transcript_3227/g.8064 Transcript_3227/m.8064 type:complete len:225 (-) Transcript_3227:502-1176(-)
MATRSRGLCGEWQLHQASSGGSANVDATGWPSSTRSPQFGWTQCRLRSNNSEREMPLKSIIKERVRLLFRHPVAMLKPTGNLLALTVRRIPYVNFIRSLFVDVVRPVVGNAARWANEKTIIRRDHANVARFALAALVQHSSPLTNESVANIRKPVEPAISVAQMLRVDLLRQMYAVCPYHFCATPLQGELQVAAANIFQGAGLTRGTHCRHLTAFHGLLSSIKV